jgi:cAMP-dependent protein kinase regulator
MSGPFSSPFGENSNPFGTDRGKRTNNAIHRVAEEEDENDTITSPTNARFGASPNSASMFSGPFGGGFGGDSSAEASSASRNVPNPDSYPAQYNFGRRTSVSAESLKPSADSYDKTPDQIERLKRAIEGNFLFSHLEDEQSAQILGALVEKPIPAKGIKVSSSRTNLRWVTDKILIGD